MEFLKKRPFAYLIAVVLICLSTLFSVHRTLGAESQKISDQFYTGVKYDGYIHKSIDSLLNTKNSAANSAASAAANYSELKEETQALRDSRNNLIEVLDGYRSKKATLNDVYSAEKALKSAFDNLDMATLGVDLSPRDSDLFEQSRTTFYSTDAVIESSGYNESVLQFYRTTINIFPTNLLSTISGVSVPQLYE